MTADKGNLIAGAALAAFGIYVIWVALRLPYVSEVGPGPGFFPIWLGIGLTTFAAALIYTSFALSENRALRESRTQPVIARSLTGWLAIMIAIALLSWIGFALSFVVLTVIMIVGLERRPVLIAVGVGAGLAVIFHLVFAVALDVSLPKAVWGF
jgi:putative tricarboxylic transport membrane protein